MKKLVLMLLVLCCLTACTNNTEEPTLNLSSKTFYDTTSGLVEPTKVWLGKDGSFVLTINYFEGFEELSGNWNVKEDVLTLTVNSPANRSNVIFEVKNEDSLILKTSLVATQDDALFSTTKPIVSDTPPIDDPEPVEPTVPEIKPEVTSEISCTGIETLYNNYWCSAGTKDWDLEIRPIPNNTTDTLKCKSNDESIVVVDDRGFATAKGIGKTTIEITCGSQKKTIGFEVRSSGSSESSSTSSSSSTEPASRWQARMTDVLEEYLPTLELHSDGTFTFIENCYAGMGKYTGIYGKTEYGYALKVKDASSMQGFAGADVPEIIFKKVDDTTLKLKTDLCMSQNGTLFDLVP